MHAQVRESVTPKGSPGHSRPLTAAKIYPPALLPAHLKRPRLSDQVCASQQVKITLFHAPAGFGKTTAMVQCVAELEKAGIDTAWITLDRGDNDAARFLECLAAAAHQMTALPSTRPQQRATAPNRSLGDSTFDIMARLAAHHSPFALILDDFECIHDATVLSLMREIIDKLPRAGRIIIGSRSIPDLGVGRLRARGQLMEMDARELRFTMNETAEFLTRCQQLPLAEDDILKLHHKTEGWIAALWLASIALTRHEARPEFVAGFSGSTGEITDYLANHVLARQSAPVRDFLLRTSILRHVDASLCDALLSRQDSQAIIDHMVSDNLFLLPLDSDGETYRYHSLFADFLRAELKRTMPQELPRLHGLASHWYEERARPVPAIDHALEEGNYPRALVLLSVHAARLLAEGRMRLLARWFAVIPERALKNEQVLVVVHAWALCFTRGAWNAMALLERSGCLGSADPKVQAWVRPLGLVLLCLMDRYEDAYEASKETLPSVPFSNPFLEGVLANVMAMIMATVGRHHESRKLLDSARFYQYDDASYFNKMYSETVEGIIDLEAGRLRQAAARFRLAVSSTHASLYNHTHGNAYAGVLYADVLYEANDLEQAENLLKVYVPAVKDACVPDHVIKGSILLSRIAFCRGDVDHAFKYLGELELSGHHQQSPRIIASAQLERARVYLLQDDGEAAKKELQRARKDGLWQRVSKLRLPAHDLDYIELAQLRWEILHGDVKLALTLLDAEIAAATAASRRRRALKLRVLQSLALEKKGDPQTALTVMTEVLRHTVIDGYQRLIIDEGDKIGMIVFHLQEQIRRDGSDRINPLLSAYIARLLQGFGPSVLAGGAAAAALTQGQPNQQLTRSETQMLSLVASGYSNLALSERLSVSISTVRTHLRNINSKLNAQNRTQAVAIARRIHLI